MLLDGKKKRKKKLLTGVKDIQNSTDGLITKLLLMRRRKIISWRKRIKTATVCVEYKSTKQAYGLCELFILCSVNNCLIVQFSKTS